MEQIVVILLTGIAFIVFALTYKAKSDARKRRRKFEDKAAEVAGQNQLTWTSIDISTHRAFAWSTDKSMLFFMDLPNEKPRVELIDMGTALHCNLVERTVSNGGGRGSGAHRQISKVELEIGLAGKSNIYLPMYCEMQDGVLERIRLTNKARHWKELIQPR
jgi:hypothetical protein